MPPTIKEAYMLDLTNKGSRVVFNTQDVDVLSVSTPMASLMGSAVVELKLGANGIGESFSPAKVISASKSVLGPIDVSGWEEVILEVTTADSSAQEIVLDSFAESTG
jgi:hypothetical protein